MAKLCGSADRRSVRKPTVASKERSGTMSRFRFGVAKRLFLGLVLLMLLALTASITGIVSLSRLGDNVSRLAHVELTILNKVTGLDLLNALDGNLAANEEAS